MEKEVAIIDYGIGNIWSVINALKYIGAQPKLVDRPADILNAPYLILPGVGSFRQGMAHLQKRGIDDAIRNAVLIRKRKILGICLGMQLLGTYGTEDGKTEGLGIISNGVECFTGKEVGGKKIPHVGFNSIIVSDNSGLFSDLPLESDFYFIHSYRMLIDYLGKDSRVGICSYGIEFLAAFEKGNVCGTQFHPEKSQTNGLILLKNFLST